MEKNTRNILKIVTFFFVMMSIFLLQENVSLAATPTTFEIVTTEGEPGEEVTVSCNMMTATQFNAADFSLNYDATKLEFVSFTVGDVLTNSTMLQCNADVNPTSNPIQIAYINTNSKNRSAGNLFNIKFKIKAEAPLGAVAISLLPEPSDSDNNGAIFSNTVVNGNVNVIKKLQSISLDKSSVTLTKAQTETLNVIYNPTDTTDSKIVAWTTGDETIATVNSNGKITAVGGGTTTVTATVGTKKATCNVSVLSPLTGISLNKNTTSLLKGQSDTINVIYTPTDTTDDKTVTWVSDDSTIAMVTNGIIKGIKEGTTTIRATVGGFTKTCTVVVSEISLNSIAISEVDFKLTKKQTKDLTVLYNPTDTTDTRDVTWSIDDSTIATVDSNGKVTALKAGTATITAKVGTKTATVKVTVEEINVKLIKISNENLTGKVGDKLQLNVTVNPENTTDDLKYAWSSSDETIAIVDLNGNVTMLKAGKVNIKVVVNDSFESQVELLVEETKVAEQEKIEEKKEDNKTSILNTGDNIIIYIVIAVVVIGGLIFVTIKSKNKDKAENKKHVK